MDDKGTPGTGPSQTLGLAELMQSWPKWPRLYRRVAMLSLIGTLEKFTDDYSMPWSTERAKGHIEIVLSSGPSGQSPKPGTVLCQQVRYRSVRAGEEPALFIPASFWAFVLQSPTLRTTFESALPAARCIDPPIVTAGPSSTKPPTKAELAEMIRVASMSGHACAVCGLPANSRCERCCVTFYCSAGHAGEHATAHEGQCSSTRVEHVTRSAADAADVYAELSAYTDANVRLLKVLEQGYKIAVNGPAPRERGEQVAAYRTTAATLHKRLRTTQAIVGKGTAWLQVQVAANGGKAVASGFLSVLEPAVDSVGRLLLQDSARGLQAGPAVATSSAGSTARDRALSEDGVRGRASSSVLAADDGSLAASHDAPSGAAGGGSGSAKANNNSGGATAALAGLRERSARLAERILAQERLASGAQATATGPGGHGPLSPTAAGAGAGAGVPQGQTERSGTGGPGGSPSDRPAGPQAERLVGFAPDRPPPLQAASATPTPNADRASAAAVQDSRVPVPDRVTWAELVSVGSEVIHHMGTMADALEAALQALTEAS